MRVSDQGGPLRARGGDEERVTPLELFFDLVFVFALTQVAGFLVDHLTWLGMLKAAALLTVLWSVVGVYSWLTNAVPAEEVIPARLVIFAATAAMFVASLAVPDAFGEYGVLFGLAYFVVHLLQVVLFALATGGEPDSAGPSSGSHRASGRPGAAHRGRLPRRPRPGVRSGPRRSRSPTVWRTSEASRASGSIPGTSPSATPSW